MKKLRMKDLQTARPDLRDRTRAELEGLIISLGGKRAAALRLFDCLYRKNAGSFSDLAGLSEDIRKKLAAEYSLLRAEPVARQVSKIDGTVKLLFKFAGGAPAESVVLFMKKRTSACLSSQSGCACGCGFCATGGLGFRRDLEPSEILGQFSACLREAGGRLDSLVFMGMGEPFLNWENVRKSILLLSDCRGLNFPQSRMTVSTVGIAPAIRDLARSELKVNLAVSVVTADERKRPELVPMDRRYPLREIMKAARFYCAHTARPVFFEYILFDGENDSTRDAEKLAGLVKGLDCRVNVIPYNGAGGGVSPAARIERAVRFQRLVMAAGVRTYLRREKGADIKAACGQLAGA